MDAEAGEITEAMLPSCSECLRQKKRCIQYTVLDRANVAVNAHVGRYVAYTVRRTRPE